MDALQPPIDISSGPHGRWTVVTVSGELDLSTVDALSGAVDDDTGDVAIAGSDIRFIDSTGLRTLLELRRDRTVVLIDPSEPVRKLLDLTHLTDAFPTVPDADDLPD